MCFQISMIWLVLYLWTRTVHACILPDKPKVTCCERTPVLLVPLKVTCVCLGRSTADCTWWPDFTAVSRTAHFLGEILCLFGLQGIRAHSGLHEWMNQWLTLQSETSSLMAKPLFLPYPFSQKLSHLGVLFVLHSPQPISFIFHQESLIHCQVVLYF